jgi:hypothetical protein
MINTLSFRSALVIAQLSWSFLRRLCTSGILLFVGRCMVCRFVINSDSFRPELIFTDICGSFLTSLLKLICGTFRPHWHTFVYHDCQGGVARVRWGPEFWLLRGKVKILQSKILYRLRPPNQKNSFSAPLTTHMIAPWRSTRSTSFRGLITLNNGPIRQSPTTSYTRSHHHPSPPPSTVIQAPIQRLSTAKRLRSVLFEDKQEDPKQATICILPHRHGRTSIDAGSTLTETDYTIKKLTGIQLWSQLWYHFGHKLPCPHHNFLTIRS